MLFHFFSPFLFCSTSTFTFLNSHCYLDCMPQRRTKWLASFLCSICAVNVMFVPPAGKTNKQKMLAVLKSGAFSHLCMARWLLSDMWYKIFLNLVSSMFARSIIYWLKEKWLKSQQLQMRDSKLSDWNRASVCTNPLMDYWLNWTEGVPGCS